MCHLAFPTRVGGILNRTAVAMCSLECQSLFLERLVDSKEKKDGKTEK